MAKKSTKSTAAKTKTPSGLTLTRNGDKFNVSWKFGDGNHGAGQTLQWRIGYYATASKKNFVYTYKTYTDAKKSTAKLAKGKTYTRLTGWTTVKGLKVTSKSASFTIPTGSYFPANKKPKVDYIEVRIRGTRSKKKGEAKKPTVSAWAGKTFQISAPNTPSISMDVQTWPTTKFSWSVADKGTDDRWIRSAKYESVLVKNSPSTITDWSRSADGKPLSKTYSSNFKNGGGATITEDSGLLADGESYTRWFRITMWGPGGTTSRTDKHVYSLPDRPRIQKQEVTVNTKENNYICRVWFDETFNNYQKPVKEMEVQYVKGTPGKDMSVPTNPSWQKGSLISPRSGDTSSGAVFYVDSLVEENQCLFFRANATYDENTSYGYSVLAEGISYSLSKPEDIVVDPPDPTTYKATITAKNTSTVPDSFLVVRYYDNLDYEDGIDIGVIPHGKSKVIVQCPSNNASRKYFGVYAAVVVGGIPQPVAAYKLTSDTSATRVDGKVYYEKTEDGEYVIAGKYIYVSTTDTTIDPTKTYYALEDGEYVEVELPIYIYVLSTDTTVDEEKTYYEYDIEEQDYVEVEPEEGDNPSALGWYEYVEEQNTNPQSKGWYEYIDDVTASPVDEGWYEVDDTIVRYTINPGMVSEIENEGGNIPMAPSNVRTAMTNVPGTVRVTWDWTWQEADSAELSWSDHEDAWESTDAPSTFEISQMKASAWNISGLDTGKKWYIRLRFISGTDQSRTYGPYSDLTESSNINLISAPLVPSLNLPENMSIITVDGSATIYWSYSTTDGTSQQFAKIAEVIEGQNDPVELMTIEGGAQSATINPSEMDPVWKAGEQHTLVVQVYSTSGLSSGRWSNPVTITIAEPIDCKINNTSLDYRFGYGLSMSSKGDSITDLDIDVGTLIGQIEATENYSFRFDVNSASIDDEEDFSADNVTISKSFIYYTLTSDAAIDPAKTYYIVTLANPISEPVNEDLLYAYELVNGEYSRTLDTQVDPSKTYYVIVTDAVQEPIVDDISTYYERNQTVSSGVTVSRENFSTYGINSIGIDQETWDPQSDTNNFIFDVTRSKAYLLRRMPLTVNVSGAGNDGTTNFTIDRADDYKVDRPDESDFNGYKDETIAVFSQTGEAEISIGLDSLVGQLDDGARYTINANVTDDIGQVAYADPVEFTVAWEHQPKEPLAEVTIDEENGIAILQPIAPDGSDDTDVCDIYRLSVDKPVLIYENAKFGTKYVDPYPTIGEYGGHRFVTKTVNGDYITEDNSFAWTDTSEEDGDIYENHANLIDFEDNQISVLYEVDLSNSWSKDFKETRYLGGSIQGDWNKAVSRTTSINSVSVSEFDQEMIQSMRRLAEFPGICHIRTKDGSSYAADIQVSETYEYTRAPRLNKYSLSITRVDPETLDGITYDSWLETHQEEEP